MACGVEASLFYFMVGNRQSGGAGWMVFCPVWCDWCVCVALEGKFFWGFGLSLEDGGRIRNHDSALPLRLANFLFAVFNLFRKGEGGGLGMVWINAPILNTSQLSSSSKTSGWGWRGGGRRRGVGGRKKGFGGGLGLMGEDGGGGEGGFGGVLELSLQLRPW